jgi:uncharacterized protein YjiS (DUF1127 family)
MSLHTVSSVEDSSRLLRPLPVSQASGRAENRAHTAQTLRRYLRHAVRTIVLWADRATQRRDLAELDDRLLHDIGKSREEARRESEKPFWMP